MAVLWVITEFNVIKIKTDIEIIGDLFFFLYFLLTYKTNDFVFVGLVISSLDFGGKFR